MSLHFATSNRLNLCSYPVVPAELAELCMLSGPRICAGNSKRVFEKKKMLRGWLWSIPDMLLSQRQQTSQEGNFSPKEAACWTQKTFGEGEIEVHDHFNCSSMSLMVGVRTLAEFRGSPRIFLFGNLNFWRAWNSKQKSTISLKAFLHLCAGNTVQLV